MWHTGLHCTPLGMLELDSTRCKWQCPMPTQRCTCQAAQQATPCACFPPSLHPASVVPWSPANSTPRMAVHKKALAPLTCRRPVRQAPLLATPMTWQQNQAALVLAGKRLRYAACSGYTATPITVPCSSLGFPTCLAVHTCRPGPGGWPLCRRLAAGARQSTASSQMNTRPATPDVAAAAHPELASLACVAADPAMLLHLHACTCS
jgi:hypothetical protein